MKKYVRSLHHPDSKRAHIPSGEEAGYEADSPQVREKADLRRFPRNPVVQRGQDPELFWMNKYGPNDDAQPTTVDIRSLYRHEHIAPEQLIKGLYRIVTSDQCSVNSGKPSQQELFSPNELFGNALGHEELDKVSDYYTHSDGWSNRLILGDSQLVMSSLLEREGMAGQVQCIYIDPPYGIKYGSNWQIKLNNRTVTDGQDDALSGEPEQIKAFRDTWELGIHSYLSYLRDRLLVAKELLHDSGSCFVQISDENVHLVRCLMDEVFGSGNFCGQIQFVKTAAQSSELMSSVCDYLVWFAKNKECVKYRQLYRDKADLATLKDAYSNVLQADGTVRKATPNELDGTTSLPKGARLFRLSPLTSQRPPGSFPFEFKGQKYLPGKQYWKTHESGLKRAAELDRLQASGRTLFYRMMLEDFPCVAFNNVWTDTQASFSDKTYVVQTNTKVIQRCILMTTDPGDLVLDPTVGSGTTGYVAEQWGRRWIGIDTSRIALNIAKTRLMTATFPFYTLYDSEEGAMAVTLKKGKGAPAFAEATAGKPRAPSEVKGHNVRYGFVYKKVPHITLRSIANNEPPAEETLYDQPLEDKKRLRVAGPFTVETLQSYDPVSPEELARQREDAGELAGFEAMIFEHLKSSGVRTGDKREQAVFTRIDRLSSPNLHAEGWYPIPAPGGTGSVRSGKKGDTEVAPPAVEKKAYLYIGPKFGTVSKQAVTDAIKACRDRRDGDWLLILGFAFEGGITELSRSFGNFQVSIVRMHDDLLQEGLLKRDKKAASFVTIGEPDIRLHKKGKTATVEIAGLDIYDPIQDVVKSRDVHDIAYWMLDDDYDGSNFVVKQVFFCGGDKDEFAQWQKELQGLAAASAKKKAEQTLKLEIDDEAFATLYGHTSRPFAIKKGQKVAVRVISQYGEETTKIVGAEL